MSQHNKINTLHNKKIIVIIKPRGQFQLDWKVANEQLAEKEIILQEEIYKQYKENLYEALFYLGFLEEVHEFSDSLSYLRRISTTFIKKLVKVPVIELRRDKVEVNLEEEDIKYLLGNISCFSSSELIDDKWLRVVWRALNKVFCTKIHNYNGSVELFFKELSPNIHGGSSTLFPFS